MSNGRERGLPNWLIAVAVLMGVGGPVAFDVIQWMQRPPSERSWQVFVFGSPTFVYLVWIALWPVALLASGRRHSTSSERTTVLDRPWLCVCVCFLAGAGAAGFFGWPVRRLPPLYHDEYSYLFQAWTFLKGRLYVPSPATPDAYRQIHVLTNPVYASRYFPGTGLWMAPFLALGAPIWGWWLANGLIAGFSAAVGRLFNSATGWAAGLLVAFSPVMVALGSLLLSPTPTMLAMAVFLWAYYSLFARPRIVVAAAAGLAIGAAFLTRPLTAVGLGFPYALYAVWAVRNGLRESRQRPALPLRCFVVLVAAFGICVVGMAAFNRSLTGKGTTTPYGVYTSRYTPSHVYGFYNVQRGKLWQSDEVDQAYDDWSDDLTPPRALTIVGRRWGRMIPWSVGWVPFLTLSIVLLGCLPWKDDRVLLCLLSVVGLTLAYAPYGFEGLLGWGYLFEATPPLLLLLSIAFGSVAHQWRERRALQWWWCGLLVLPIVSNLGWTIPAVFAEGSELVHPRLQANRQALLEQQASKDGPILVVVDADPKDSLHSTYVHNKPTLDGPVVRVWNVPNLQQVLAAHPKRAVYLYQPKTRLWRRLRGAEKP